MSGMQLNEWNGSPSGPAARQAKGKINQLFIVMIELMIVSCGVFVLPPLSLFICWLWLPPSAANEFHSINSFKLISFHHSCPFLSLIKRRLAAALAWFDLLIDLIYWRKRLVDCLNELATKPITNHCGVWNEISTKQAAHQSTINFSFFTNSERKVFIFDWFTCELIKNDIITVRLHTTFMVNMIYWWRKGTDEIK